jgi:hypothetical protein
MEDLKICWVADEIRTDHLLNKKSWVFLQTSEKDNVQHNICIAVFSNAWSVNGHVRNLNSSVGIGTCYGLVGWISIPDRGRDFSLLHSIQTLSGTHPASYPMSTGSSFPAGEVTGAWSWPLTTS